MKDKIKITLSGFVVGAIAFIAAQLIGCISTAEEKNEANTKAVNIKQEEKEDHSCCSTDEGMGEYSENSIYQLDSKWTNQSEQNVKLAEFEGKPVVFTMFFASCTYACPILINDMKKIESKLSKEELEDYRFVLVSIDPERDTPRALNQFAEKHNLNLNRWTLLNGDKDDVLELAAVLGFKYKRDESGEYSHSNLINILNDKGEVVYQHVGLNQDISLAAEKLNELQNL